MNAALLESIYDLYEIGGVELAMHGARGVKRELLLDLEIDVLP